MSKLIITRGLPGSGKTTWAKDFCAWEPGRRVRVNRDDLRAMLYGNDYQGNYEREQLVTKIQHQAIRDMLRAGRIVVVDDTNLVLKFAKQLARIAYEEGVPFEVNDEFLSVPLDECLRRNAARPVESRVPNSVIEGMYHRHQLSGRGLQPVVYEPSAELSIERYVAPAGKPKAILVDIDGTMALMNGRGPFDWWAVGDDIPNQPVVDLVWIYYRSAWADAEVIFMSGRDEVCRKETTDWLAQLGFANHKLYMRPSLPAGVQQPKDSVVKLALFNEHIRHAYDVQFVLDDRDQVVEMWRKLGLTCLQVAPGAF